MIISISYGCKYYLCGDYMQDSEHKSAPTTYMIPTELPTNSCCLP